jgi:outer membrane protein TolC
MLGRAGFWVLVLVLGVSVVSAGEPSSQYQATLEELIASARAANPGYQAAALKERAAGWRPWDAGTPDPPTLGVEFFQAPITSFPDPLKDQMEIDYSIQQMIPFPGKLSVMARAERAGRAVAAAERTGTERTIVSALKRDFAELCFLWRRQEVLAQDAAVLRSLAAVTSSLYSVGMTGQADVLRVQTELASLQADSVGAAQDVAAMTAMVNAWAGRPVETEIAPVAEFVPDSLEPSYDALCSLAVRYRPDLVAMTAEAKMKGAEATAQLSEFLPDFMVRGTYKNMLQAEDDWSVMFGMTLPTSWSLPKFSSRYEQRRLATRQAQLEADNMRNMAFAEIRGLQGRLSGLRSRMDIQHTRVIPAAQRTYESSLAQYRTGKTEFPMVIDAQRMYLMNVMEYHMTVMSYLQARAALEQATGADLDGSAAEPEGK